VAREAELRSAGQPRATVPTRIIAAFFFWFGMVA